MNRFLGVFFLTFVIFFADCSAKRTALRQLPPDLRHEFVYIPAGDALVDGEAFAVQGFWMAKYELNNASYLMFLNSLKAQGRHGDYALALPDSARWNDPGIEKEIFMLYYFRHPGFQNHPVVNITREAAELYCEWLTEKYNAQTDGGKRYVFRLPTRHEWLLAAQAGADRPYAWRSPYLIDSSNGRLRANFKNIPNETLRFNRETMRLEIAERNRGYLLLKQNADGSLGISPTITTPVNSFGPGISGLYNLNGNVAEMVQEEGIAVGGSWNCLGYEVQNTAVMTFSKPSPFIGFRVVMTLEQPRQ